MLVDHVLLGPSGIYVICDLTGGCDGPAATARGAGSRVVDLAAEACAEHAERVGDVLARGTATGSARSCASTTPRNAAR